MLVGAVGARTRRKRRSFEMRDSADGALVPVRSVNSRW